MHKTGFWFVFCCPVPINQCLGNQGTKMRTLASFEDISIL